MRIILYLILQIRILPEWNVKMQQHESKRQQHQIRILPEWNVKCEYYEFRGTLKSIRILPEWNVKMTFRHNTNYYIILESYQSGM